MTLERYLADYAGQPTTNTLRHRLAALAGCLVDPTRAPAGTQGAQGHPDAASVSRKAGRTTAAFPADANGQLTHRRDRSRRPVRLDELRQ